MKEINLQAPMDEYFLSSTPTIRISLILLLLLLGFRHFTLSPN